MLDTGVIVAIVTTVVGAITICLQQFKFRYNHQPDGLYELVIGFDRQASDRPQTSRSS
jgi:hypothetical protein